MHFDRPALLFFPLLLRRLPRQPPACGPSSQRSETAARTLCSGDLGGGGLADAGCFGEIAQGDVQFAEELLRVGVDGGLVFVAEVFAVGVAVDVGEGRVGAWGIVLSAGWMRGGEVGLADCAEVVC